MKVFLTGIAGFVGMHVAKRLVSRGDEVVGVMFDLVRETGASMLLVTHDETLAARCDRTIAIDNGKVRDPVRGPIRGRVGP